MPQPVTTAELLLEQVAGLLTEIRDLLPQADQPAEPTAAAEPAAPAPRKRATKSKT